MGTPGTEVAKAQDLIPGMSDKTESLKAEFLRQFDQRQIPEVEIREEDIGGLTSSRKYTLIQKTVGTGALATSAVRIEPYGADLLVELRHFESSTLGTAGKGLQYYLALSFIAAGLLTIWLAGVGLILVIIGAVIWPRGGAPEFSGTQRQDSFLLKEAVEISLKNALDVVVRGG